MQGCKPAHFSATEYFSRTSSESVSRDSTSILSVTTSGLWLNRAKFVASFEEGDFVYVVMREFSEDRYQATIGRVCKSDPGFSQVCFKTVVTPSVERAIAEFLLIA